MRYGLLLSLLVLGCQQSYGQTLTTTSYLVPGSDNWKVKLGLNGVTAWWTPYGGGSLPWADALNQITWEMFFGSTHISMIQASAYVAGNGSGGSASGSIDFKLKYEGSRTDEFRSFLPSQAGHQPIRAETSRQRTD